MELQEITDLIAIRNYLSQSSSSYNFDKPTVNILSSMLTLLDKKIARLLQSDDFKEYIGYLDLQRSKEEAYHGNIKSGLK